MTENATSVEVPGSSGGDVDHGHDNLATTGKSQDPEVLLMLAFQAGDESAFVRLFELYRLRIINFCRRFLGDLARSEEAAQDVFLKLYSSKDRYQVKSRFSTYLYRIASNHCLNIAGRAEQRLMARDEVPENVMHTAASQTQSVSNAELRTALHENLALLPAPQRLALVLCCYEGLRYQEAATAMDVSLSALKSLVFRARERMMKALAPDVHGRHTR